MMVVRLVRLDQTDRAEMLLEFHPYYRWQRRHVFSFDPVSTTGIENLCQLVKHKPSVVASPQDGRNHARQRHDKGHVFRVLRIDKNLEGAAAGVVDDVVDAEKVSVIAPAEFVGLALQNAWPRHLHGPGWLNFGNWLCRCGAEHAAGYRVGAIGRAALASRTISLKINVLEGVEGDVLSRDTTDGRLATRSDGRFG
jgi:hypothetical protein